MTHLAPFLLPALVGTVASLALIGALALWIGGAITDFLAVMAVLVIPYALVWVADAAVTRQRRAGQ